MKTKTKLKQENRKQLKTKTKKIENEYKNAKTCHSTKVLAYNTALTGAMAIRC